MGFYYKYKKIYRLIDKTKFAICIVIGLCFVLFLNEHLYDSNDKHELRKAYLGRQNEKWRFGKLSDGQQQDDVMSIAVKTKSHLFYKLSAEELNKGIVLTLELQHTVLIRTHQKIDKFSLIKNFLCSSESHDMFPICGRILYYHMCTFDDDSSKNVVMFIKKFAIDIFALSPEIGLEMYLDSDVEGYLNGNLCLANLKKCLNHLVINPLHKVSKAFPKKIFLIAINFVDDCFLLGGNSIKTTIVHVLGYLRTEISAQFKYVLITRQPFTNEEIYGWFDIRGFIDTYDMTIGLTKVTGHTGLMFDGSDIRIGYSMDSIECLLICILLCCMHLVELHKFYHNPLTIVIVTFYVKKIILCGIPVCFSVSLAILFLRYILRNIRPLFHHKRASSDWFYRINLLCDNFAVHCIVDQRLERKYSKLKSLYSRKSSVDHLIVDVKKSIEIDQLNQESMSEFEQLYTMKKTTILNESQDILRSNLLNASENKLSILCRWLLVNIGNKDVDNKHIEQAMIIAMRNLDHFTARAVSWCITQIFYRSFHVFLKNAYEIYPGLKCDCHTKGNSTNPLCSRKILIIILTGQPLNGLPQRYKGFTVEVHNMNDISSPSEGMKISNRLSEMENSSHLKVNISEEQAENLFHRHTNLSLICASIYRSFSFQSKHFIKQELCIQFFCKIKGVLPLGEDHFPDSICEIPTDVIEGTTSMLSKLHIGDKIGPSTQTGTLGGFIKYLGFDCFLTCAHVMYDLQTLLSSSANSALLHETKAYLHMTQPLFECGKVIWRTFEYDKLKTSVDAALVVLQNNATMDKHDYIIDERGIPCPYTRLGLPEEYLNLSCLDHEEFCVLQQTAKVVGAGAGTKLENCVTFLGRSYLDISIAHSNMVQPLHTSFPVHIQGSAGQLTNIQTFRMYNQMVINLGLQPGDSGTCIYVVQHPQNKTGCIGMAIAFCGGYTIVTPLKDILKRIYKS